MKIGIIGPIGRVDKINHVIKRDFVDIEPVNLVYSVYTEAPGILQYQQPYLDAVLLAGTVPYALCAEAVKQTIPWECIPRRGSSLLRALLAVALLKRYDIGHVSFDSYHRDELYEVYGEVGIDRSKLSIFLAEVNPFDPHYLEYVFNFHRQKFQERRVCCCLTALESIYKKLQMADIPCLLIEPTANIIKETLLKLQLRRQAHVSQQGRIVAVGIHIDTVNEHSLFVDNEYQYMINKMNVTKYIYLFAQRLQAAVAMMGEGEFLLLSTRYSLETETNNLASIDLLTEVVEHTANSVSIGIGFGKTAWEAKRAAKRAMARAISDGGNAAYMVDEEQQVMERIKNKDRHAATANRIDDKFLRIAEQIGISINTIFRVYSVMQNQGQTHFTAAELAKKLSVTPRTANRIISKLETGGFCRESGKRILANTGRPSRIMEIRL